MSKQQIRISGAVKESITDGPGIRYTLFTQGCPHHCPGCHNPETHPFEGGEMKSADDIFAEIAQNPLLSGVTLSGGEPFLQAEALLPLAEKIKAIGLELAAYTGFLYEDLLLCEKEKQLLRYLDILVDGKFEETKKSLELNFKGSANQRTIDVQKSLAKGEVVLTTDPRWVLKGGDFYLEIHL